MVERGNAIYRKLDRYAGIPLAMLSGGMRKKDKTVLDVCEAGRIGVLCLGAIGDMLLASALVNGLAARAPQASIEVISSRANACALELLGNAGRKSAFAVKNPLALLNYVRSRKFDFFFDTTQWARLGALVSNFSRARCAIGFDTPGQHRAYGYDVKVPHRNDRHELANFLDLGKALMDDFTGEPGLVLPDDFNNPHKGAKNVYLHLWPAKGRGSELKKWPEEFWAELAKILLDEGYAIYLTGSEADAPGNAAFLRRFFAGERGIMSVAGEFSLAGLACLLRDARALVSVNTGIMHLGAIIGTPTIGLHGATNPLRWGPIGPKCTSLVPRRGKYAYLNLGFEYPDDAQPAMQWLPVDDVVQALARLGVF